MVQVMEYLFVYATFSIILVLGMVHIYMNDYILGVTNKKAALSAANWYTLFYFIEFFTFKALPLATKCALSSFLYYDLLLKP